jgi:hypothetical protein
MSPVMNGPVAPISTMFKETAPAMVDTSQPNARWSGTIITPGAARTATPASIPQNMTAKASHA